MKIFPSRSLFYHPLSWILLYLSIHFAVRMLFSQTLQIDDAEQTEYAQILALGYPFPQPPLYSWLSWALFQIFGTGLFALTLLKYTLIALTGWLTWLISGYLFRHLQSRWLALSAYLLMPSFAWHMHQGFTHTILLGFAIALSLHALLRLHDTPSLGNYLYWGIALSIGLLSKYSFLLYMALLLLATATIPSYRQALLNRYSLFAAILFLLVIAPHGIWLLQHHQQVFGAIDTKLQVTDESSMIEQIQSLGRFIVAAIAFVTPFSIIYLVSHSRQIFRRKYRSNDNQRLLSQFYLFLILISITLALFVSMPHFKVRWFHPLMMIFPLWLIGHIEGEQLHSRPKMLWITYSTIVLTICILSVRILQVNWAPELGHYGRLNRPIVEAINQLPQPIANTQHLITSDSFLGAHLLAQYQDKTITIRDHTYRDPTTTTIKPCLWLWDDDTDQRPPKWPSLPMESGKIILPVAEFNYTLHYALLPSSACH